MNEPRSECPPPSSGKYPTPAPGGEPQQSPPPPPPAQDDCPDPFGPYTDYRVAVSVAKKQSDLYAADATVVDAEYKKLDGAQGKYEAAWAAQKTAWEDDVKCRLKRIGDTLKRALDDKTRKHLWDCWKKVRDETDATTAPTDCSEIDGMDCDDVDELLNSGSSDENVAKLRRLAILAAACVAQGDTVFGELAGFPEGLEAKITDLKNRVADLDGDPAADLRRSYVKYLTIYHDFCWLEERRRTSAATYACKLKTAFVALLKTHRTAICIQVAIHAIDERVKIEDDARKDKAKNLEDLVLECAREESAGQDGSPSSKQGEYPSGSESEGRATAATPR